MPLPDAPLADAVPPDGRGHGRDAPGADPNPVSVLLLLRRVDCVDGVAAYLASLVTGLRARGDRVVMASGPVTVPPGAENRHATIRDGVAEWLRFDGLSPRRPRKAEVDAILALMRRHDVRVISPQGFGVLPLGRLLALLSRKPTVAHYHPSAFLPAGARVGAPPTLRQRLAYRATARLFGADRYIAGSTETVGFFRDVCGIPDSRVRKIVFGIDDRLYRPPDGAEHAAARAAFDIPINTMVCVLPGRMNVVKGHDVLVDAVRLLRERRPEIRLVCLFPGGGDQRDALMAHAHRDGADRQAFRFLGFIDEIRDAYWAADLMVLPSRSEGFAIVVPEAMACGLVPLRTPSGGWQDQIADGVNGFVFPYDDAPALAGRLEQLADDPKLRAAMRERSIAIASERFGVDAMVDATSRLFRDTANARLTRAG